MKKLILAVAFCLIAATANAQPDPHSYTCGELVIALDKNDNSVLVNSAADATVYLRTYWPQIAANPVAIHNISVETVDICEAAVKEHSSDMPIQKVLEAAAALLEGAE